jgi:hydroxymethylbilane synthase
MKERIRLGTRGSQLAMTQSGRVADALSLATGVRVDLVVIRTKGDDVADKPLQMVGGKGLFTKEIEDALIANEVDVAVHSLKDMPTETPPGLVIACVPERADPRDAIVGSTVDALAQGAVVGTGSLRRTLQLRALRPDVVVRGIRGNVDTRIRKQREGDYDAVLLALAGLERLGLTAAATEAIDIDRMVPAVGQGALAVQCRTADREVLALVDTIHHKPTGVCVEAERAFLVAIEGGCSVPAACHARWVDGLIVADAVWADDGDAVPRRLQLSADPLHVHALGTELARRLRHG